MEISQIKQQLEITQVAEQLGIVINPRSKRALCPFHPDKTPSLQFSKEKQIATCFSSNCSAGTMDVIKLTEKKLQKTTHETLKYLSELAGEVAPPSNNKKQQTEPKQYKDIATLKKVFGYFEAAFFASKPARDYAISRNLNIKTVTIGYNTGLFHHGKNNFLVESSVQLGLLIPHKNTGGNSVFGLGSLVFALRDKQNQVTGLYYRAVEPRPNKLKGRNYEKHLYLKNRSGLYPNYPKADTKTLILTESIIDAATLLQHREITTDYEILAIYGTNGLTAEIKQAITELEQLEEVILFFDGDAAGRKAITTNGTTLKELLPTVQISVVNTLENEDINSIAVGHEPKIFTQLLEERTSFFLSNENQLKEKGPSVETSNLKLQTSNLETSNSNKITYSTETATYSILGGFPKQLDMLKVMLQVENKQGFKSRNKVDLYEDKQVERLCKEVAEKLHIRKDLMEQDIYTLTNLLENHREKLQEKDEPKAPPSEGLGRLFTLKERTALESFLKQPRVIKRLNELLGKTGIVGEERNRIFLMLVAISYKMKDPLHSLIQGSSGSGKTKIVRQVSDCIPQESVTRFTRISDKALYNYPKSYFTNRLLIVEDVDGLSEDAEMAFRELQSSGELRSSVSIKLENGSITGGEKVVNGPIASMSCTTKGEIYEDNMSRVFLIAVDESTEQTKRIIQYQNQKASGKINSKEEQQAKTFIQNLIRIIAAKEVINPFAEKIQLPEEAHKIRRLNDLFQNFIKMVTLINQYQRKQTPQGKLIAEIEDVETAIEIMFESIVLKVDELDGSLRQFYEKLKSYLQQHYKGNYSKVEFTQREVRQHLHLSKAQINRYLQSLTELEYLQSNGFANKGFKYKIAYWDNYEALRKRIKENLTNQIAALKVRATSEPLMSH